MRVTFDPMLSFDQCAGLSAATILGCLLLLADPRTRRDSSSAMLTTAAAVPGAAWCIELCATGWCCTNLAPLWMWGILVGFFCLMASFAIDPPSEASTTNNAVRVLGVCAWAAAMNMAALYAASI
jgi:hypothetical protein